MKKAAVLLLLFVLSFHGVVFAQTQPAELANEQAEKLEMEKIDQFWHELEREAGEYMPDFYWRDIFSWFLPGEEGALPLSQVFLGLWRFLWREIVLNVSLLGRLVFLAVVAALLNNLQRAFISENVAQIGKTVVYLILISIALQSFAVSIELARTTVNDMVEFLLALFPLLLTLLASLGSFASAAIFRPMVVFAVNFFAALIRDIVLPLIFLATILYLANNISPRVTVARLADLFKNFAVWALGLSLTLFSGIMAVHGVASAVGDAVTIRTAKFVTGAFLPVVGGMLADAVETVVSATLILKNTVHVAGVLLLFYMVAFPLLKILALVFIYKLAAAIIQPLGEDALCDTLNTMGNCLTLIFAAVATVSLMFYMAVTIIAGAGNTSFMLR